MQDKKRGQVTIFIIIAVLIVAGVLSYFLLREKIPIKPSTKKFSNVENYFLDCIGEQAKQGVTILEEQGGYIYLPEFQAGTEYFPSSSQLNFLGSQIQYWYYFSGNKIVKERIPSKQDMQNQLSNFISERLLECDLNNFILQGYDIKTGKADIETKIENEKISIKIEMPLSIAFGDEKVVFKYHDTEIKTKLGKFYNLGKRIYNKEKQTAFLENYALDVIRLYAPVDNAEISCSPKVWKVDEISDNIQNALEANMQAIRLSGKYAYKEKDKKYFVADIESDESVRFLYSKNWPTRIEVFPSENNIMIAEPVGLQPGLSILGFCYVPYHFVYDVVYPVLVQLYDEKEFFQFPLIVLIDKNQARESLDISAIQEVEPELCKYKVQDIEVYTYDTELNPVEADISFKCLNMRCDIGNTKKTGNEAYLKTQFPQCLNGFILASAQGFKQAKHQISTNQENSVDVILEKLYTLNLELKLNSQNYKDTTILHFSSPQHSFTVAYPEQKEIQLAEGSYNISAYTYSPSSLKISSQIIKKCIDMPKPGIFGFFGATEEKCFDIEMPSQTITNALSGGGKTTYFVTESELKTANSLEIKIPKLPTPTSIEKLQENYQLIEIKKLDLNFK